MLISERLHEYGIPHLLRRESGERPAPGWVARVCEGRRGSLTREHFFERYGEIAGGGRPADEIWELLANLSQDDERISLEALSKAIREDRLPDELCVADDARIVVSTVHRAKGLEFDDVIVVRPEDWRIGRGDPGEEARVFFVAMTRARCNLFRMEAVDTGGWRRDEASGRWVRVFPGQEWSTHGFELRGGDMEHMHPGGTWIFESDPIRVQQELQEMPVGTELRLELREGWRDDGQTAHYVLYRGDTPVGVTGADFASALARRLAGWSGAPSRWPIRIEGVRLEGVDTVAGLEGVGEEAGLGTRGLWLRPRVVGLGDVVWS
jgi:hypothetical protein